METRHIVIVDVYGDSDHLRLFSPEDRGEFDQALSDWRELDRKFSIGEIFEGGPDDRLSSGLWWPFTQYMELRGFEAFTSERVHL